MPSLETVLNAFIAAAVCGFCVAGLFKRSKERRVARTPTVAEMHERRA